MKKTGAELVRYALERIGARFTFGIPGVHTTEIYDQLASSPTVTPIRVTAEVGGAFMADAVSRTNRFPGVLLIVPAAGTAMAYPGIGEAFLDGIPMLVISGGVRSDVPFRYQLHEIDQLEMVRPITKERWRIATHADVVPTIFEAWRIAASGEPGPVFVEVPVNIQLFPGEVGTLPEFEPLSPSNPPDPAEIDAARRIIEAAEHPGLFLGWGARDATEFAIELAERLDAPVATTLQGLSVFPAAHPLHTGMGVGPSATPAGTNAFADCDALIAVGTRFSEIATGSFGLKPTWKLIHADINPNVFNVNYRAAATITGDARDVLKTLLERLPRQRERARARDGAALRQRIAADKQGYLDEWLNHNPHGRVNPARFFLALRQRLAENSYLVADDGNHTFLVAELFAATRSRRVISPSDFNCMGYCVPAAIGVKLTHPEQEVVGIVGDGAFLMTGTEILTATEHKLGIVYYVFHDGELSQISQAQTLPYNRKACTVLPQVQIKGIADAVGAAYFEMANDAAIERVIEEAQGTSHTGQPVIVDVRIDYSKATRFTKGIIRANFGRLSLADKARAMGRAAWRHTVAPPDGEPKS